LHNHFILNAIVLHRCRPGPASFHGKNPFLALILAFFAHRGSPAELRACQAENREKMRQSIAF
jgi:hypothetical protein